MDSLLARLAESTPARPVPVGRYDVIGRLGQGGMGSVFEAIDRTRSTRVALKTLLAADAAAGVRLKREFRIVADLAHPNLVPVYELGCEDGLWYFTMELIDGVGFTKWACGPSLDRPTAQLPMTHGTTQNMTTQSFRRDLEIVVGPAPAAPSVELQALRDALAQLANGLSALHDAGLWHGDVKPDNILIRPDGRVVVVDFGLVEAVGTIHARRGSTIGTPAYMSSEQLAGAGAGAPADWYAVGTMLYEALTRRLPFDADSMLDLYFQKTHHTPPTPRELVPELPEDLSEVCMSLLQAAPDRRPSGTQLVRLFAGHERARERLADQPVRSIFVGRKRELRVIEQAYGLARGGTPMVVHAHGPSGIGKSAMLRSFTRGVEDIDRALVLRSRCYERESVPYKAFDGLMDELAGWLARRDSMAGTEARPTGAVALPEWIGELARVFPALTAVPAIAARVTTTSLEAAVLRTRAWTALRELFAVLAADHAVVLSIDDLQWADADSAQLLESIVREIGPKTRLLVVASYRVAEAEANPALAKYFELCRKLAGERRIVEVPLGPLPPAEAEQVARSALRGIGGSASDQRLRFLAEEASGVPFFIEELARFAATRDLGDETDISLDDAIRARVRAIPADQRALIEVVAIADIPVPQSLVFEAAGLPAGALSALLALRSASLIGSTGANIDDLVSTYHDRIRESVIAGMDDATKRARHLALGRAIVARHLTSPIGSWVYQAVRHLAAADERASELADRKGSGQGKVTPSVDSRANNAITAKLALEAGRLARQTAAFPLAFSCFERGIGALPDDAWTTAYDLALQLHSGAAEAAYLCAEWGAMDRRCGEVIQHGRTPLDQLVAWEVKIDAFIGRHEYRAALDAGREALASLGVTLLRDATPADLGIVVEKALADLTAIGPEALAAMPDVSDPIIAAAMRVQIRLAPAAYFGQQMLLPVIACNLISASVARGLSTATPYALALFGLVLNTLGMYPTAHVWGSLAVKLLDRWDDRRLEAATRHVVFNLVCAWMVPLHSILAPLREVWDIGRRTGDLEYASYAAHGYVHDCLYAGKPLEPLLEEALQLGAQMRSLGQVNAVHVHAPFEQLLKGMCGRLPDPPSLDDDSFSERGELESAVADGSRSGTFVQRLAIGLARFYLGSRREAFVHFDVAYAYRDAGPSVWHQPILNEYYALSACAMLPTRPDLRATIDTQLAALRVLAGHCEANFAHRVLMIEAEVARVTGDSSTAAAKFAEALALARRHEWHGDVALILELAGERAASAAAYEAWGALAVASRLRRDDA